MEERLEGLEGFPPIRGREIRRPRGFQSILGREIRRQLGGFPPIRGREILEGLEGFRRFLEERLEGLD